MGKSARLKAERQGRLKAPKISDIAIKAYLCDPDLLEWLIAQWASLGDRQTLEPIIKNLLAKLTQMWLSDRTQDSTVHLDGNTDLAIGINGYTCRLWCFSHHSRKIISLPDWHKSAFDFQGCSR